MQRHLVGLALVATVLAAACGSDTSTVDHGTDPPAGIVVGAPIPGGGLTVSEALTTDAQGPLTVSGFVIQESSGTVRLCEAVAESFPPQCGGVSVEVEDFDPATSPDAQREGDIVWIDQMSLTGELVGEVFTASSTSQ